MEATYKRVRRGQMDRHARAAVFLDRDGVLIEDTGYISHPDQILHIAGSAAAVARLNQAGFPVVLITNQSGVGRGFYTWQDFEAVQAVIEERLAEEGAWLDGVWACGHHPEAADEAADHPWRKPNPGMIEDAAQELGLAVERSWLAGDRVSDLEAGLRAGVHGLIHIAATAAGETSGLAGGDRILLHRNLAGAVDEILRVR